VDGGSAGAHTPDVSTRWRTRYTRVKSGSTRRLPWFS